ncbi:MAG: histidinol phosphatase, partial [Aeromicrobium sp.]
MGWQNPDVSWRELERRLSGRPREMRTGWPDGGDGPAFSRKRERYEPDRRPEPPPGPVVPYAELHCHSSYSFLDGASNPE